MRVTPTLSAAEAVIVTTPDTVCPAVGEEMATVGGVVSFVTVTVTGALEPMLPAASKACAVRVCDPLVGVVVFELIEYGGVVTAAPRLAPSMSELNPRDAHVVGGGGRHRKGRSPTRLPHWPEPSRIPWGASSQPSQVLRKSRSPSPLPRASMLAPMSVPSV